jgi:hypothetical protein
MQNTVSFTLPASGKTVNFTVKGDNRPFSNNFVLMGIKRFVRTRNGRPAVSVLVKCTNDSREPGRIYYCVFTYKGTLCECHTVN